MRFAIRAALFAIRIGDFLHISRAYFEAAALRFHLQGDGVRNCIVPTMSASTSGCCRPIRRYPGWGVLYTGDAAQQKQSDSRKFCIYVISADFSENQSGTSNAKGGMRFAGYSSLC